MKRKAGEDAFTKPSRRTRLSSIFDISSQATTLDNICRTNTRTGYIMGRVAMVWDLRKTPRFLFEVMYQEKPSVLTVSFSLECGRRLLAAGFKLTTDDELYLDLEGVTLINFSANNSDIPFKLKYKDDIHMKRIVHNRKEDNTVFDTRQCSNDADVDPLIKSEDTPSSLISRLSENSRLSLGEDRLEHDDSFSTSGSVSVINHINVAGPTSPATHASPLDANNVSQFTLNNTPAIEPTNIYSTLQQLAGKCIIPILYKNLSSQQVGTISTVIGIVKSTSPVTRTSISHFKRTISLIDPSTCNDDECTVYNPKSFLAICFTHEFQKWLPCPEVGDVIILKNIKIDGFQENMSGIGYYYDLQWIVYRKCTQTFDHGQIDDIPIYASLSKDGGGVSFSPFLWRDISKLSPFELQQQRILGQYCANLLAWNTEVEAVRGKSNPNEQIIYIGQSDSVSSVNPIANRREHRLIQHLTTATKFFDCTVEILPDAHYSMSNRCYKVYVTDYTRNGQLFNNPRSQPANLDYCVLPIELWDAAKDIGPSMSPGTFYTLKNVCTRMSRSGYLEAKISAPKITLLDHAEGTTAVNVNLENILELKKEWLNNPKANEIQYLAIENMTARKPASCMVEVIHVEKDYMYVTDYSRHKWLVDVCYEGEWFTEDLKGLVIRIGLSEAQGISAALIPNGMFCSIDSLVFKLKGVVFQGTIAGTVRCIRPHPYGSMLDNEKEALRLLEKRKAAHLHGASSVDDVHKMVENAEIQVVGRITGYHPVEVKDFVVPYCTLCKEHLLSNQTLCPKCMRSPNDYGYRFVVEIEVENEVIHVEVFNNEADWWRTKPTASKVQEDDFALEMLMSSLEEDILGDLELQPTKGPTRTFKIVSRGKGRLQLLDIEFGSATVR